LYLGAENFGVLIPKNVPTNHPHGCGVSSRYSDLLIDLDERRQQSLQRLKAQISEMQKVQRGLALGGPAHALVKNIIDRLKAKAERLSPAPRVVSAARRRKMN
jgi:hypothetical protein